MIMLHKRNITISCSSLSPYPLTCVFTTGNIQDTDFLSYIARVESAITFTSLLVLRSLLLPLPPPTIASHFYCLSCPTVFCSSSFTSFLPPLLCSQSLLFSTAFLFLFVVSLSTHLHFHCTVIFNASLRAYFFQQIL